MVSALRTMLLLSPTLAAIVPAIQAANLIYPYGVVTSDDETLPSQTPAGQVYGIFTKVSGTTVPLFDGGVLGLPKGSLRITMHFPAPLYDIGTVEATMDGIQSDLYLQNGNGIPLVSVEWTPCGEPMPGAIATAQTEPTAQEIKADLLITYGLNK